MVGRTSGKQKEGDTALEIKKWHCLQMDPTQTASDKNKGQHSCPKPRKDGRSKGEKRRDRRINSRQTGCPSIHLSKVIHFLGGMSPSSSTKIYGGMKGCVGRNPLFGDRKIREGESETEGKTKKERNTERQREGYYIISTFFPPPLK